jgi:hypothetical protein
VRGKGVVDPHAKWLCAKPTDPLRVLRASGAKGEGRSKGWGHLTRLGGTTGCRRAIGPFFQCG